MLTSPHSPDRKFDDLVQRVHGCQKCPDMAGCSRVLSDANGPASARVMFIGEAPGRLGADRTAVPFHGDVAGDNFERLLSLAGVSRRDVFVTNSVLCNPRDDKGNNAPPSKIAIKNCSAFLAQQIEIIQPDIIVTLGAAALSALKEIESHDYALSKDVRKILIWNQRKLIPLYHPGARAMVHRSFAAQTADYYFLGEQISRLNKSPRRAASKMPARLGWEVVRHIINSAEEISLFKLHKILYLLEKRYIDENGARLTDFFYIRQKDGPYCVELGSRWHKSFPGVELYFRNGIPIVRAVDGGLFRLESEVDLECRSYLDGQIASLLPLDERQLKARAYLTEPMKQALRAERAGLVGLNRALI